MFDSAPFEGRRLEMLLGHAYVGCRFWRMVVPSGVLKTGQSEGFIDIFLLKFQPNSLPHK
jgi:hypothetical protein